MNSRSKYSLLFVSLIVFSILVTSVVPVGQQASPTNPNISEEQVEEFEPQDNFISSYILHSSINIASNADFESQDFPGNGTSVNPYIIDGYNITTIETCVLIENTDAYFVIRDCLLTGGVSGHGISGIILYNATHGEIRNNTISQKENGVLLERSPNNVVVNNTISGNDYGVQVYYGSYNNVVVNNTIYGNLVGIYLCQGYTESTLSTNNMVNNGVLITGNDVEYWRHNITPDNLVNGKPLGYFWNVTSGTIDGTQYGQVILANCTGVTVENGMFNNASGGLLLGYSTNCSLKKNLLSGNNNGVYLYMSTNNTVLNNTVYRNEYGMFLYYSSNNTIVNNTISENSNSGMYLWAVSDGNLIYLNVIAYNAYQNAYDDGTGNHWNSTRLGNYWSDYSGTGVYLVEGGSIDYYPFMYPPDTTPPTIDHPADMNYDEGTTGNFIEWTPIDAYPSHYILYRNGMEVISAIWDWFFIYMDIDGLSVGVYNCTIVVYDTSGNWATDTVFVTVSETTTPTIDHPENLAYYEGITGNSVTWNPSDAYPSHYVLYRNSVEILSDSWNGSSITVEVDGLSVGVYNYTIMVYDTSENWVSDTILVTVTETIIPTIDHPENLAYYEGITGNSVTWNPSDAYPSHYVVSRNGTEVVSNNWDGSPIIVNVDGLSMGVYNYSIVVHDTSGNIVSDIVIVTVLPQTSTTTATTTTTTTTATITNTGDFTMLILGIGGVGSVIVVIVLVIVRRHS